MRMPSYRTLDLSLSKSFPLYRKAKVEFRIDAFNALNTNNWSSINGTANFASMGATAPLNIASSSNLLGFGAVTGQTNPRQMQAMARFSF
jgi:hypothetical protein